MTASLICLVSAAGHRGRCEQLLDLAALLHEGLWRQEATRRVRGSSSNSSTTAQAAVRNARHGWLRCSTCDLLLGCTRGSSLLPLLTQETHVLYSWARDKACRATLMSQARTLGRYRPHLAAQEHQGHLGLALKCQQ